MIIVLIIDIQSSTLFGILQSFVFTVVSSGRYAYLKIDIKPSKVNIVMLKLLVRWIIMIIIAIKFRHISELIVCSLRVRFLIWSWKLNVWSKSVSCMITWNSLTRLLIRIIHSCMMESLIITLSIVLLIIDISFREHRMVPTWGSRMCV